MSSSTQTNNVHYILLVTILAAAYTTSCWGFALPSLPSLDSLRPVDENTTYIELESSNNSTNETTKNLYVIKAVVYEIGILTEGNENDTSFESQERVDLTFFDAHTNVSHIDLGNIPLPIQTNISGQVLTGIAPVNVGAFSSPSELLQTLPLTGTIVNITHSDTAFYKLTKSNGSGADNFYVDNEDLTSNLANLLKAPSEGVNAKSAEGVDRSAESNSVEK